jgi:hypothetical protein
MAKYVIEDTSPNPRRCIVSAGLFKSANYKEGFSNRPQALRDCFDYHTGDLLSEAEINYKWFDGDHAVSLGDGFIAIDAGLGPRNVILPPLVEMAVGRIFYIAKTDPTSNAVTVSAQPEEEINGGAPVTLVSPREAFMIVHAGTAWLGFKIA